MDYQDKNLKILEDCCEAHGGERKGIKLGAYGDLSALSFFVAHNITTVEGGMVFSSDEEKLKLHLFKNFIISGFI